MKKIYFIFLTAIIFSSCGVSVNYLGNSFKQTSHVDVYVDPGAIKKPYTIIGKGYERSITYGPNHIEKLQDKAVQIARQKGADAVLFQDYYLVQGATTVSTSSRTDTLQKAIVTTGNTSITPVFSSGRHILFLKYN